MSPALVIIDMQRGMGSTLAGERNNPNAERNIAALLATWRAVRAPIALVCYISRTLGSRFWPGQPGVEFQPDLDGEFATVAKTDELRNEL